jgi:hypothetical protein
VQGVDHEPGGGGSAAAVGVPGGFGVDPAQVAVLLQQPGLVHLGTIDTGLEVIAAAGNDFQLTIEPLD